MNFTFGDKKIDVLRVFRIPRVNSADPRLALGYDLLSLSAAQPNSYKRSRHQRSSLSVLLAQLIILNGSYEVRRRLPIRDSCRLSWLGFFDHQLQMCPVQTPVPLFDQYARSGHPTVLYGHVSKSQT